MIDNKKEQEREELHRAIWAIADELRGAVDGWDFKNYVLGTMFYRYISENITAYINEGEHKAGNTGFNYARLSDSEAEQARADLVKEKGFFILPSELFCNVRAKAQHDENLNETLERVFAHIEDSAQGSESENSFAGLFDDFDVNSNKLGSTVAKRNERLAKLLDGIAAMNLGSVKDHDIDAFGDAYEYLMTMYASNAGKSGGEFFTPADVSELLTRLGTVVKKTINKVYDPACGSGSLLLKAEKVLGKDAILNGFYGQEINITTYNLCRINMFLHDIGFDKFDIACEDTLINPQHWDDEPFELIVSNPPYSIKWDGDNNPLLINDQRFAPAGVLAPKSKADFAFIMHSLSWLAPNGVAAIVCFPGIMSRPGVEQKIRKYLVDNNYVDCIIQLPANLFFGTPIATCIMVLRKGKKDNKTLFIEATDECVKITNNNKLTEENINRIVDVYSNRNEIRHFSHLADYEEIVEKNYNLSVSSFVEKVDKKEKINIDELTAFLEKTVSEKSILIENINNVVNEIKSSTSLGNTELSNLISRLCPSGVEYRELEAVCSITKGVQFNKSDMQKEGSYPVINGGINPSGYIEQYNQDENTITISQGGASAGYVNWITTKFWAGAHCYILKPKNAILNRYLFHFVKGQEKKLQECQYGAGIPALGKSTVSKLLIPVPPIPVQQEIVNLLDKFTELTAELTARLKQYDYYREILMTPKNKND